MLRISPSMPAPHDLHAGVSSAAGPFAAGPGVLLLVMLVAALLVGAFARAMAAVWVLMRSMLALLGGLALALTVLVLLASQILSDNGTPEQRAPGQRPRVSPTVVPSQLAQHPAHTTVS